MAKKKLRSVAALLGVHFWICRHELSESDH